MKDGDTVHAVQFAPWLEIDSVALRQTVCGCGLSHPTVNGELCNEISSEPPDCGRVDVVGDSEDNDGPSGAFTDERATRLEVCACVRGAGLIDPGCDVDSSLETNRGICGGTSEDAVEIDRGCGVRSDASDVEKREKRKKALFHLSIPTRGNPCVY